MQERAEIQKPHDWGPYATGIANNISLDLLSSNDENLKEAQSEIGLYKFLHLYGEGLGGMVLTRLMANGIILDLP